MIKIGNEILKKEKISIKKSEKKGKVIRIFKNQAEVLIQWTEDETCTIEKINSLTLI